jgi:hypothetical protein
MSSLARSVILDGLGPPVDQLIFGCIAAFTYGATSPPSLQIQLSRSPHISERLQQDMSAMSYANDLVSSGLMSTEIH